MTKMFVTVKGKTKEHDFCFDGNREFLSEWREQGLDVYVINNEIPLWVVELGIVREWCWLQDLFCKERKIF